MVPLVIDHGHECGQPLWWTMVEQSFTAPDHGSEPWSKTLMPFNKTWPMSMFMVDHGSSWSTIVVHGSIHGISWLNIYYGQPWLTMLFHGWPWSVAMNHHGLIQQFQLKTRLVSTVKDNLSFFPVNNPQGIFIANRFEASGCFMDSMKRSHIYFIAVDHSVDGSTTFQDSILLSEVEIWDYHDKSQVL